MIDQPPDKRIESGERLVRCRRSNTSMMLGLIQTDKVNGQKPRRFTIEDVADQFDTGAVAGAMVSSEKQRASGRAKLTALPEYCRRCDVRFACNGESPPNRFESLCADYRTFFKHIEPYMQFMASEFRQHRSPANVMNLFRSNKVLDKSVPFKPGRNDPCPCGSGKKYKKCCGRTLT